MPLANLDKRALRDHAEEMLLAVSADIRSPQTEQQRSDKAKGLQPDNASQLTCAAESHAVSRFGDQFTLDQLVAEFRAFRASVFKNWAGWPRQVERLKN